MRFLLYRRGKSQDDNVWRWAGRCKTFYLAFKQFNELENTLSLIRDVENSVQVARIDEPLPSRVGLITASEWAFPTEADKVRIDNLLKTSERSKLRRCVAKQVRCICLCSWFLVFDVFAFYRRAAFLNPLFCDRDGLACADEAE